MNRRGASPTRFPGSAEQVFRSGRAAQSHNQPEPSTRNRFKPGAGRRSASIRPILSLREKPRKSMKRQRRPRHRQHEVPRKDNSAAPLRSGCCRRRVRAAHALWGACCPVHFGTPGRYVPEVPSVRVRRRSATTFSSTSIPPPSQRTSMRSTVARLPRPKCKREPKWPW